VRTFAAALLLLAMTAGAEAQRPGRGGGVGGGGGGEPRQREELEADIRRAFARVVRQRVGLNDEQMQKLGPLTERHAIARRRLQMDERALRAQMQVELLKDAPSDSAVNRMLEQFTEIQKRRVQMMESEQKDFATVMTPVQRARFNAMQEQLRRQLEQRRGGRAPERRGPPPGR
jgi:Spy/CpxP family protein refolding chaperone